MTTRRRLIAVAAFALAKILLVLPIAGAVVGIADAPQVLPGFKTIPPEGVIDPDLRTKLIEAGPAGLVTAFVHFSESTSYDEGITAIENAGLSISIDLPAGHLAYAYGSAGDFLVLSRAREVVFLEHAGTEPLLMSTAPWATRARTLHEGTGGLDLRVQDRNGDYIDGQGVGVAVVDSGIDGNHPDLKWAGFNQDSDPGNDVSDPKVIKNFKVLCTMPNLSDAGCAGGIVMQDVADSDTTSGHGTHVAATVAGDGTASDSDGDLSTTGDRMFRGVAPRAKLYGFGTGEGLSVLVPNAAASFQWIYDNGMSQDPPIRVVTNSWGGAGSHNPSLAISKLSNALVKDKNITVLFSAGNSDGDGSTLETSTYGNNPTPGVLNVASYDDLGRGTRSGNVSGFSSRGLASDKSTWPDVSAPGSLITSACKISTVTCPTGIPLEYPPNYTTISGTSMATPHTAGAVALLYQADSTIEPAEVEDVFEDTAHKFTFGSGYVADLPQNNSDSTTSFDKGHGLIDARQAVLRGLGLRSDTGVSTGSSPSISIATPEDLQSVSSTFEIAGGASTGAGATGGALTTVVASGDPNNDFPATPAVDLTGLELTEDLTSGTIIIRWKLVSTDPPPIGSTYRYRFAGSLDGTPLPLASFFVNRTSTAITCSGTPGCTASVDAANSAIVATFSATQLGAVRGKVMFDMWADTMAGVGVIVAQDRVPGSLGGTSGTTHPARGQEHVFAGNPVTDPGPAAEVFLSIDGVPYASNPIGTGMGTFLWDETLTLAERSTCYTLSVELRIGGLLVSTDSVCVFVGTPAIDPGIIITSPDEGAEVPATLIEVRGSSNSDPSHRPASVTVQASGTGYDSGPISATDDSGDGSFSTWSAQLDLSSATGSVSIEARLHLDNRPADPDATDQATVTIVCGGNFEDDLEGPEPLFLPFMPEPGWTFEVARNDLSSPTWSLASDPISVNHSLPTTWFSDATSPGIKDDRLIAPPQIFTSSTELRFWHRFTLESDLSTVGFDGGVLELSADGGPWVDVLAAGATFLPDDDGFDGGYNGVISTEFESPIAGRQAWTQFSRFDSGLNEVIVDFPSSLAGKTVSVRWRLGLDNGVLIPGTGWWIDDISFVNIVPPECLETNNPPDAFDDSSTTSRNTAVVIPVLANDTDPDGDPLSVTHVQSPSDQGGIVTNNGDTVTYTPPNEFEGTDTFTYTIGDGQGGTDTASVTITVTSSPTQGNDCDPRGVGFWKKQASQGNSTKFTAAEYESLTNRAAERSEGYFADGSSVTSALLQAGNGAKVKAERQFAALLLNFAAFDLSGTMSHTAGLDPLTSLDPQVYDTSEFDTADEAASWIRRGLETNTNLGTANEVGSSINNGQGLKC